MSGRGQSRLSCASKSVEKLRTEAAEEDTLTGVKTNLMAFFVYSLAAEVYVDVSLTLFSPIAL